MLTVAVADDKSIEIIDMSDKNSSTTIDWRFIPPERYVVAKIVSNGEELNITEVQTAVETSIYFLIDTSIPMREAYQIGAKPLLKGLIGKLNKKRHHIAIAGFDKELNRVYRFGQNSISYIDALDSIKVNGQRTELYRLSIEAMGELAKEKNIRKILVLISDGDFEDTTYTVDNLIEEAKKSKIQILALGYRDSIKLQGILKPTKESGGKMWIADKKTHQMPSSFIGEIVPYFDNGGVIKFSKNELNATKTGEQSVTLELLLEDNKSIKKEFSVAVNKIKEEKEFDWRDYMGYIFLLFAFLLGAIFIVLLRKDKKEEEIEGGEPEPTEPIAYLQVQSGERYEIIKNTTSIGKSEDNDIVIAGSYISRYHAEILYKDEEFLISDRNSVNGIGVNSPALREGEGKITQSKLKNGDKIYLGPLELFFERVI
jgi:hypothetical protein